MNIQPLIFILLFGGVQGILLALFFIQKKLYQSAYVFLLLYLAAMLLQLTFKVMSKIWLMDNWPAFYYFSYWLPLLYGPLIYLFVKNLFPTGSYRIKDLLHFMPAVAACTVIFMDEAGLIHSSLAMIFFNPYSRLAILIASILSYHIAAFRLLKQQGFTIKNYFSDAAFLQLTWMRQLIFVSVVTCLVIAAALHFLYIWYPRWHEFRYGFASLSFCIYWFSYTALTKPFIFSVIKGRGKEDTDKELLIPPLKVYKPVEKYANSTLTSEEATHICTQMKKLMEEKKLYLEPELTIAQLSASLECSRHHLSQVLNEKLGKSYYEYINCLRVEEAKRLLQDQTYLQQKISSVAYDCGFNSLSTFNDVFKKHTGKTPSGYRKETLKESRRQRV